MLSINRSIGSVSRKGQGWVARQRPKPTFRQVCTWWATITWRLKLKLSLFQKVGCTLGRSHTVWDVTALGLSQFHETGGLSRATLAVNRLGRCRASGHVHTPHTRHTHRTHARTLACTHTYTYTHTHTLQQKIPTNVDIVVYYLLLYNAQEWLDQWALRRFGYNHLSMRPDGACGSVKKMNSLHGKSVIFCT